MTYIEKCTVFAALCEYEKAESRRAESQRERGEIAQARKHERSANMAKAMKYTWAEILAAPSGTVTI